jgi:hypothetical protein
MAVLFLGACGSGSISHTGDGGPGDGAAVDVPAGDGAGGDEAAGDGAIGDGPAGDGAGPSDPLDPGLRPVIDTDPSHYPANVWVTGPLEKLGPAATPGDVRWALLAAARNEFESFQVHVRASGASLALTVEIGDLVDARSGTTIAAATSTVVWREAYLDLAHVSDQNGTAGLLPDPLVPAVDPTAHEARNAFPVTVPAGETRSAWIDVQVPRDAPSGYYLGSVTVRDGATTLATLPVLLKVWDFVLPSTATLKSFFGLGWNGLCVQAYGGYSGCGAYPGASGNADRGVELTHVATASLFLDYRVTVDYVYAGPSGSDWTHFDQVYTPLLDGTAATRLPGAAVTSLRFTGDRSSATAVQQWVEHCRTKGWLDRLFDYTCDEPPAGCSWTDALSRAEGDHAASADLRTLLTTDLQHATDHGLLDAVDILTPVVDYLHPRLGTDQRSSYDAWLADPTKHLWWYQSCDQHESCSNGSPGGAASTWPSYMVDATPVRNRVFQWLAYLYRIEAELYYDVDYCWTTNCDGANDPWVSIYAFGGNGDGTLEYPGTPAKIGGTTPIAVPSVRLKLIRDGMEDFEYLHALDAAGDGAFATSTARAFITDATTFDNDPAALQAARQALGDRLHHLVHP